MAYLINNYNGTPLVNVQDRTLDIATTSIKLPGRDYRPYGETMVENLIYMLQHFAQGVAPANPISGQIWYDTTFKQVKVYDATTLSWLAVGSPQSGSTQPASGSVGQVFYNTTKRQLFVWDANAVFPEPNWRLVGPVGAYDNSDPNTELPTHSTWEVVKIQDTTSPTPVTRTIWRLAIAGTLVAVVATESFNANITGFTDPIQPGINLRTAYRFVGQASSAITATSAITQPAGNSSNLIATTSFVTNAVSGKANANGDALQTFEVANAVTSTQAVNLSQLNSAIPVGIMMEYPGAVVPSGWLLCDGSAVSRFTYAALYAVIGTTFGAGNGTTTFNVPDRRGRFGLGASGSYPLASTGGSMTSGSTNLTIDQIPAHNHTGITNTTGNHFHQQGSEALYNNYGGGGFVGLRTYPEGPHDSLAGQNTSTQGDHSHTLIINNNGGSLGHDHPVTPPYVAFNYLIKV